MTSPRGSEEAGCNGFSETLIRSTWYVADAKSVWSWRKIVESSAEFYVDSRACVRVGCE